MRIEIAVWPFRTDREAANRSKRQMQEATPIAIGEEAGFVFVEE